VSPPRLRSAPTPRAVLHRLGRLPNPLDWPPVDRIGANRFDDPARQFRVLYGARQRTACFAETLAVFRPSLELLAETGDPADITGDVSAGFLRARGTATFHLRRGRWLDVRRLQTLDALRSALGPRLHEFGLVDVDLGGVCGPERAFTQAVAAWAYENGYNGIVYASRFGASFECWAIFDSANIESVGSVVPLSLDDTDLPGSRARICTATP
jgi:RES domain